MLPCPVVKVHGKLQRSNPGRMRKDTHASGMKVWVTPARKEPRPSKVLAEGGGNSDLEVEEGVISPGQGHVTSCKTKHYN